MKTKLLYVITFLAISSSLTSQNLLNTNTWTVSSGSVTGFSQNGVTSENSREYNTGPKGNSVLVWKGSPSGNYYGDGGWNSSFQNIDHTKTYRFVIWLKKTNSNDGNSYFGFNANNSGSLNLNGTYNNNPYFWSGDLPQLNKWYMLVGYVHGSSYNSTTNYGAIYDGATGQKVRGITDYKLKNNVTTIRHRTYLYYDYNTSDRQYFYNPRMEKVDGNEPSIEELLGINSTTSTNLLNTSTWAISSGSATGFSQNGSTSENIRELGRNHIGEQVVLWKASPGSDNGADGGWNSGYVGVNANNSYRYSVWIKKTNSNYGSTYFGFNANNSGSLRLDGTYNSNPYFWSGDLPKLNRWYLLVGYVHRSSHSNTTNIGGIYDGVTGEKVSTITDYKLKSNVTSIRHRAYLYYDTNTLDRQYFYDPRIDHINGNEPTIHELLKIKDESKLIFSYDLAGNQTQNFYCGDPTYCAPPAARKQKEKEEYDSPPIEDDTEDEITSNFDAHVYPNPTSGYVTLKLDNELLKNIHSVKLFNTNSVLIKNINAKNNNIRIDMTKLPAGVYIIHIHVNKGKSITKKIIKK